MLLFYCTLHGDCRAKSPAGFYLCGIPALGETLDQRPTEGPSHQHWESMNFFTQATEMPVMERSLHFPLCRGSPGLDT